MVSRAVVAFRHGMVEAFPSKRGNKASEQVVLSLNHELMRLGYILSKGAFDALAASHVEHVTKLYAELVEYAAYIKNSTKKFTPLWKNFPNDVLNASLCELYTVAIAHYWTNGAFSPNAFSDLIAQDRTFKYEHKLFKTLELAPHDWAQQLATELASFPKPLDPQSLLDLKYLVAHVDGIKLPAISVKETLAAVVSVGGKVTINSVTDVLRVALAMSGADVSLSLPAVPKNVRGWRASEIINEAKEKRKAQEFKSFSRAERRNLLAMLEGIKNLDVGDMQTHVGRWLRLGERLHPGEFASKFPRAHAAFQRLRNQQNGNKVRTFESRVATALNKSLKHGLKVLEDRPGVLARRLDSLLRPPVNSTGDISPVKSFKKVIKGISTKVLFEMYDHFEARRREQARMVMVKGSKNARVLNTLAPLDAKIVDEVQLTIEDEMMARAAKLPGMGKVYISDELFKMPVPYSMQSLSEGARTLVRGTRMKLSEEANVVRGYQFWHDNDGRLDLDLGATFLSVDFKLLGECTFYDLRSTYAAHSGDVRHRKGNNAEFIDIDIEKAIKNGVRYVLFNVYNYNGGPLSGIPQAAFGVMERSAPRSNEIFDPATSSSAIKVSAMSSTYTPVIVDLVDRTWIWLDMEAGSERAGVRLQASDLPVLRTKLDVILNGIKFSVANLLLMHAAARHGELVSSPEEADVVFTGDIMSDYTKLAPYMAI